MRSTILVTTGALALLGGCQNQQGYDGATDNAMLVDNAANGADPAAMIFCAEVQRRTSRTDCDDLTATAQAASRGTAAFNVPPMTRGRATPIQLVISLDPPMTWEEPVPAAEGKADNEAAAPGDAITNESDGKDAGNAATPPPAPSRSPASDNPAEVVEAMPGPTEHYSPLVGRHMRAEMIGQGFEIKARSPASQDLNPGGTTSWDWEVTPLKASSYVLTIKTVVEGETADGKRFPLRSTVENREVVVATRWYQRLWDGLAGAPEWIAAVTAVLSALALLAGAWWKFWRAARGEKPAEEDKAGK